MPSPTLVFDILGWVGAASVVIPYGLVVTGRIAGTTTAYRAANIVGGVLLLLNTWYHAIGVYAMTSRRTVP